MQIRFRSWLLNHFNFLSHFCLKPSPIIVSSLLSFGMVHMPLNLRATCFVFTIVAPTIFYLFALYSASAFQIYCDVQQTTALQVFAIATIAKPLATFNFGLAHPKLYSSFRDHFVPPCSRVCFTTTSKSPKLNFNTTPTNIMSVPAATENNDVVINSEDHVDDILSSDFALDTQPLPSLENLSNHHTNQPISSNIEQFLSSSDLPEDDPNTLPRDAPTHSINNTEKGYSVDTRNHYDGMDSAVNPENRSLSESVSPSCLIYDQNGSSADQVNNSSLIGHSEDEKEINSTWSTPNESDENQMEDDSDNSDECNTSTQLDNPCNIDYMYPEMTLSALASHNELEAQNFVSSALNKALGFSPQVDIHERIPNEDELKLEFNEEALYCLGMLPEGANLGDQHLPTDDLKGSLTTLRDEKNYSDFSGSELHEPEQHLENSNHNSEEQPLNEHASDQTGKNDHPQTMEIDLQGDDLFSMHPFHKMVSDVSSKHEDGEELSSRQNLELNATANGSTNQSDPSNFRRTLFPALSDEDNKAGSDGLHLSTNQPTSGQQHCEAMSSASLLAVSQPLNASLKNKEDHSQNARGATFLPSDDQPKFHIMNNAEAQESGFVGGFTSREGCEERVNGGQMEAAILPIATENLPEYDTSNIKPITNGGVESTHQERLGSDKGQAALELKNQFEIEDLLSPGQLTSQNTPCSFQVSPSQLISAPGSKHLPGKVSNCVQIPGPQSHQPQQITQKVPLPRKNPTSVQSTTGFFGTQTPDATPPVYDPRLVHATQISTSAIAAQFKTYDAKPPVVMQNNIAQIHNMLNSSRRTSCNEPISVDDMWPQTNPYGPYVPQKPQNKQSLRAVPYAATPLKVHADRATKNRHQLVAKRQLKRAARQANRNENRQKAKAGKGKRGPKTHLQQNHQQKPSSHSKYVGVNLTNTMTPATGINNDNESKTKDEASAQSPNARQSGAQSSGAQSSGAQSLGAQSSGTQSSGAQSSGAQSSDAKSSGAKSSGAKSSGAKSSGAKSLGAKSSGAKSSEGRSKLSITKGKVAKAGGDRRTGNRNVCESFLQP